MRESWCAAEHLNLWVSGSGNTHGKESLRPRSDTMIRAHSLLLLDTSTPSPLDQDICTEMLFLQEAMYHIVHLVRTIQIIQKISGIGWRPSGQMASSL